VIAARLGLAIALAACSSSSGPPTNQGSSAPVAPVATTPDAPAPALAARCEQALRNYTSLVFWSQQEAQLAALPPAEREAARTRKQHEYTSQIDRELANQVRQCEAANNAVQIDCLIVARTADAARACMDPGPER
jgi:hypothetical protein